MDGLVHLASLISDGVHSPEMSRRLVNQGATIPVVLAVVLSRYILVVSAAVTTCKLFVKILFLSADYFYAPTNFLNC